MLFLSIRTYVRVRTHTHTHTNTPTHTRTHRGSKFCSFMVKVASQLLVNICMVAQLQCYMVKYVYIVYIVGSYLANYVHVASYVLQNTRKWEVIIHLLCQCTNIQPICLAIQLMREISFQLYFTIASQLASYIVRRKITL